VRCSSSPLRTTTLSRNLQHRSVPNADPIRSSCANQPKTAGRCHGRSTTEWARLSSGAIYETTARVVPASAGAGAVVPDLDRLHHSQVAQLELEHVHLPCLTHVNTPTRHAYVNTPDFRQTRTRAAAPAGRECGARVATAGLSRRGLCEGLGRGCALEVGVAVKAAWERDRKGGRQAQRPPATTEPSLLASGRVSWQHDGCSCGEGADGCAPAYGCMGSVSSVACACAYLRTLELVAVVRVSQRELRRSSRSVQRHVDVCVRAGEPAQRPTRIARTG
jgi:hypothetical protein